MDRNSTRLLAVPALAGIIFILTSALLTANAQTPPKPDSQVAPPQTQTLTADQLTDLVAPIALYPDGLLSQVLVASTYPLEVVEAQQWLQRNSTLSGTQLTDAAKQQSWDPGVQMLVVFPDVLNRLSQDIRWTTDLGNAFLAQQTDVMAAVQRLRSSAQANRRLTSTPQQTVSTETQDGQPAIVIQPANPDVIYVPVYDPAYVWGPPVWGYYPSLYYPAFGFGWGPAIDIGFCFGGWGGWGGWGWGPNWFDRTVFVNNLFFHRYGFHGVRDASFNRAPWAHNPDHRLGIPYPNRQLAGRYQAASTASRANFGRFGGYNPVNQPNGSNRNEFQGGARPGNLPNANHPTMPGNRVSPRVSPQGGTAGSFSAPQSMRMPSAPRYNPSFNGGAMRGFGGGHGFGGGFGGGGHSFGGGGHGHR
jgi:uncharacterized membrane protein YgcG